VTVGTQLKETLAGLKGVQNTVKIYALQTENQDIKKVFQEAVCVTGEIIQDLEERLKILEFEEPQYKGL
jgi:hypothetical protein